MNLLRRSRGYHIVVEALVALFVYSPTLANASEDPSNANAEVAGQRAHFAREFCSVPAEQIEQYKLEFKGRSEASDFELWWARGWHNEVSQAVQLRAMRDSNPKEYALRVKGSCARLKWQAKNALRRTK
ncbi:hypothetical protein [Paraburkholderia fynbosensis]|uniref:Uncharacterized protein n=1 Tax=Paraburkholderia fynbosensis TaxID=1200993 RepID=A0A6J5GZN1_9BURK|nr:hypothetical protein [Paraburkholderia fynbosensis]CAB3809583.1 hypothetical protein LMG27177_06838 [Paraburkholderia fynbosensis]